MIIRSSRGRGIAFAVLATLSASGLGGCSGGLDGVELNGKIFEAVGLSTGSLGKKTEVATQARAPLVLPPDANRLPEPGDAPQAAAVDQAWPKDPQQQKTANAEARKRAQEQYCRDGNWKEKALNKDDTKAMHGPDGPCNGSLFSIMSNSLFGNSN